MNLLTEEQVMSSIEQQYTASMELMLKAKEEGRKANEETHLHHMEMLEALILAIGIPIVFGHNLSVGYHESLTTATNGGVIYTGGCFRPWRDTVRAK